MFIVSVFVSATIYSIYVAFDEAAQKRYTRNDSTIGTLFGYAFLETFLVMASAYIFLILQIRAKNKHLDSEHNFFFKE